MTLGQVAAKVVLTAINLVFSVSFKQIFLNVDVAEFL